MQISDLRIGIDDLFTVNRNLKPERSVHCGMLRSDIQNLRMSQAHRLRVLFRPFDDR